MAPVLDFSCLGFDPSGSPILPLYALRKLMQGPEDIPKAPLGNNARPLQPLYHRTVRTNIDFNNQGIKKEFDVFATHSNLQSRLSA
ncbi:hypothetical protein J437_LFUL006645 [Ladona fulva]|uniref:Uncharacterized protein n=1 Tax=Ladona fulva TaxID=123851 RepID=A0A8K0K496_LADFU|nr:hypothetical protein J437_LFUL006645 [Ladona fulva]